MKRNKNGFTLAELLVVLAIIALLTSIAMPIFSTQLERARETVDMSNARAASSLAYTEYMLCHGEGEITYIFGSDNSNALFILAHKDSAGTDFDDGSDTDGTEAVPVCAKLYGVPLTVVVDGGKVTENTWLEKLGE